MTRLSSSLAVVGLLVVASPVTIWAQSAPTTQQQPQQASPQNRSPFRSAGGDRRFDGRGFGGGGGGGDAGMRPPRMEWRRGDARPDFPGGGGEQQDYQEPTSKEWEDVEAFMKKHSPRRLEKMDQIDDERQQAVKRMLVTRYRNLQDLKDQDQELYDIRVDRMRIEDDVFGLGWDLNHPGNDKSEEVRKELRAKLRLLFKSGLQERAHRLKHWEKVLEQHRKSLKEDEAKLDTAVDRYMADVQNENWPRFLRPLPPQRRQRPSGDGDDGMSGSGEFAAPAPPPAREEKAPE